MLDRVLFFNAQEIVKTNIGYKIYRYDRQTLSKIDTGVNPNAPWMGRYSCGTEIRFYSDSDVITVTLLPEAADGNVCFYAGNYFAGKYELKAGQYTTLVLRKPDFFDKVDSSFFDDNTFDKNVWRICPHNCIITLCDIDNVNGILRLPEKDEMPSKTMLAYGSSITHGAGAISNPYCYIENVGRLLGVNILNKGLGGSCFCEKEVVDMLVKNEFDYAYLELGVNMLKKINPDEFRRRIDYLVGKIAEKNIPVFMTTIYRYHSLYFNDKEFMSNFNAYNEYIRDIFNTYKKDNWKLLDGRKIVADTTYLTTDGIHPSTEGHFEMAHNIVDQIKDLITL